MTAEREQRAMNRLRAGAGAYACGGFLAGQSALQRSEICTSLLFDRLERKMRMVEALRHEAAENWNQTFYLLYFRTLGDRQNQEAYLTLARRVSYKTVLRERLAPHAVESLLFGASGLLALYPHDTYTLNLARNFEYLAAKYDIEPMQAGAWQLGDIRPANHPVLRLAQAAEFFAQDEFVMERAMACRTEEEIRRLFCVEASDYWRTHHIPGIAGDDRPKRLGAFKANIIGINLVSVLQFAYGSYTGRGEDKSRNMVRVGDEITKMLEKSGYKVIHDTEIHDRKYTGAYDHSKVNVEAYLKKYPSIQVVLDIHRDAIHLSNGNKIKPTAEINGKKAAQIMIITGAQEGKVKGFPDWEQNLRFAVKLQQTCETMYPGLMRPILFSQRKYNMNLSHCNLLLEMGSDANTLEEAAYSGRLVATAIAKLLDEYSA